VQWMQGKQMGGDEGFGEPGFEEPGEPGAGEEPQEDFDLGEEGAGADDFELEDVG